MLLDPSLPLYQAGTVDQMLGFALFPSQAAAVALTAFGVLAIMLSATGIHGLVTYAVSRRQREIGIRIAIGASTGNVLRVVLGRLAILLGIGALVGLALAIAAGSALSAIVYQASPHDPAVLGAVAAVFLAIGVLSSWGPARRALRVEPIRALRPD